MVREINYEDWLYDTSPSAKAAEMRMKNVTQLFSWVTQMLEGEDDEEPMTLAQVVTRLTLRDMMERNEDEEDTDQVQLMTLHASKGLGIPLCIFDRYGRRSTYRTKPVWTKVTLKKSAA